MSDLINTIPEGKFRVIKAGSKDSVLIKDFDCSEDAFKAAREHNNTSGTGDMFVSPLLVFNHAGSLLYGPADYVAADSMI